jgi:hypothetical protein
MQAPFPAVLEIQSSYAYISIRFMYGLIHLFPGITNIRIDVNE